MLTGRVGLVGQRILARKWAGRARADSVAANRAGKKLKFASARARVSQCARPPLTMGSCGNFAKSTLPLERKRCKGQSLAVRLALETARLCFSSLRFDSAWTPGGGRCHCHHSVLLTTAKTRDREGEGRRKLELICVPDQRATWSCFPPHACANQRGLQWQFLEAWKLLVNLPVLFSSLV